MNTAKKRPESRPEALAEALAEEKARALETLLQRMTDDARREPAAYLRETIVPEGGE